MSPWDASVIIPVRNGEKTLASCLSGLRRQGLSLQVIVVDDGSTDKTATIAKSFGALVVNTGAGESSGLGAGIARNMGLQVASCESVLFTDADCIPCPGWAKALLAALNQAGVVASKGSYRSRQVEYTARFLQAEYQSRYSHMLASDKVDFLDTYSLGVKKSLLKLAGNFSSNLPGACVEDQEMSFRLLEQGKFVFVPQAVVDHKHANSPKSYIKKKFKIGWGKATLLRSYPDRARGDSHTPKSLVAQMATSLFGVFFLLVAPIFPSLFVPALILLALPIPLSAKLLKEVWREYRDPALMLFSIAMTSARALSLFAGLMTGFAKPMRNEASSGEELHCLDEGLELPSWFEAEVESEAASETAQEEQEVNGLDAQEESSNSEIIYGSHS